MLMRVTAGLVAVCCSHWGDRCSGRPAHCRVLSDSPGLGVCLNYEALQNREMKGVQGERHIQSQRKSQTLLSRRHRGMTRRGEGLKWERHTEITLVFDGIRCTARRGRVRTLCRANTPTSFLCSLMLTLKKEHFNSELRWMLGYISWLTFPCTISCIFLDNKWYALSLKCLQVFKISTKWQCEEYSEV